MQQKYSNLVLPATFYEICLKSTVKLTGEKKHTHKCTYIYNKLLN